MRKKKYLVITVCKGSAEQATYIRDIHTHSHYNQQEMNTINIRNANSSKLVNSSIESNGKAHILTKDNLFFIEHFAYQLGDIKFNFSHKCFKKETSV